MISHFGSSHVGAVRDRNEDAWAADPESGLYLVADGMGGRSAGDIASRIVADAVRLAVRDDLIGNVGADPLDILRDAMYAAGVAVKHDALKHREREGMGAAATAALISGGYYCLAHIGDTRAYLLRDGSLCVLTRDHTQASDMIRSGSFDPEDAAVARGRHVLTRAIGCGNPTPDCYRGIWESGDLLLLCSDGLHGLVADHALASILAQSGGQLDVAARTMIAAALTAGGNDNITVLLVHDVERPATEPSVPGLLCDDDGAVAVRSDWRPSRGGG